MAHLFSVEPPTDAYDRPCFSKADKLRRLAWSIAWWLLCRHTPRPLFAWRAWVLRRFGAKIGAGNYIYPKVSIWAPWLLETEDVVTLADGVEVYNPGGVVLRSHAIVSQAAYLCGASHDFNSKAFPMTWKRIEIGRYAWVCSRAIVLPGVTVGDYAVLGAGAVTAKSLEPYGVYTGNPAKKTGVRQLSEA